MSNDRPQPSYRPEPPAVATRVVVSVALGFLAFVGISLFLLRIYYGDEINQATFAPPAAFVRPQLQTDDVADLAKLRNRQRRELSEYAWVDHDKGIVRIPIEDAMKLIVARGADAYAPIDSIAPMQQPADVGTGKSR
jgi:hypothetical protein